MNFLTALLLLSIGTLLPVVNGSYSDTFKLVNDTNGCITLVHNFDPLTHKPIYRIGIYTSETDETAFRNYNVTYEQYLTATAGQRFDPPIKFEMVPVNLETLSQKASKEEVDFFFSSSAVFSCMASEQGAQALTTIINRREARGHAYDLDTYGGVIFTLATNDEVNTLEDLRGKSIGAGGITMMGGGQTQFYEMFRAGLSYVADPAQVIFTTDERKTVQGVLDGDFEIGMARTDQIERHTDANGELIDPDIFKVINPQIHVMQDGQLFPFVSSTSLHPEWPTAALSHVNRDVSLEVQDALLALQDHATSLILGKSLRCDTTLELAELARFAKESGQYTGYRTARSYFGVRTKQQAAGFLYQNEKQESHCIRSETLYEDIRCPSGQYKLTEEEFEKSCEIKGLECPHGYQCYCKPCIKAYEVAVFQSTEDRLANNITGSEDGCDKMSLCGIVEQTKKIHFEIVDNRKREDPVVEVDIHLDFTTVHMDVAPVPDKAYTYELVWSHDYAQIGIMNIFFDSEQIPQSPVRIQVVERRCDLDFPGQKRTATADGGCACGEGNMEIRGKCVESTIMAVVISIAAVILVTILGVCYVRYRNHKNDEMWQVNIEELTFDDPVEVIGQGSFGVVLLGQYRGTKVALKRALKIGAKGSRSGTKRRNGSKGGSKVSEQSKGSRGSDRNHADSIGLSSAPSSDDADPEAGVANEEEESCVSSQVSGSANGASSGNMRSRSSGRDSRSLGFLAQDFGPRSKWAFLFPWMRNDSYHYRFKEAILGSSGDVSMGKTWHAILCPWFNAQIRAEEEFIVEMRVLSRLRHPCVTTVLGAVISRNHDPMLVCRDVAQGLRFLHSSKPPIMHGDLKGRNILIDSRFRAKLCDFGLSTKKQSLITGTPYWLAPEYLRGQTGYTTQCDIYSCAIILYEIYAREDPYKGEDFRDTLRKVCDRRVNKRPGVPETCPPKIAELMKKCWSPDPFFRPQAKDLDTQFLDMNIRDAEPLTSEEQDALREKRRTGDMLYEIFPKHIADQLKAGQKVEPENHEEVTVVFSDIVHFTDISRALTPLKVSQMLDRLYMAFDKVARKNEVFKVETIGE
eukprot:scaffold200_cov173-Amphora_coffeaeformis.AAC.4